jgi:hypothetical protein
MNTLALGALTAVSVATASGAGCSTTKPTELVPGVSSQVVVPHDLASVRLTVEANGGVVFDRYYAVGPAGDVSLPSTLGVLSGQSPETVITITVRGYDTSCDENPDCNSPTPAPPGTPGASHILRRSVQTFVDQHTLFVPLPLSYSCWDHDCGDETMGCAANTCVPTTTSTTALVDFVPSLIDGTDVCFSPSECFGDNPEGGANLTVPPELVDAASCTYAFPGPAPLGLNVRAYYQNFDWTPAGKGAYFPSLSEGGEQEILNEDPVEGFTLVSSPPDGGLAGEALFKLAPGLCQLVQQANNPPPSPAAGGASGYITISGLRVANLCPPKKPLLPICAGERTNGPALPTGEVSTNGTCNVAVPLAPTQSALYLLMDHSDVMHGAFGPMGSARALSLSLSDPVFKRTFAAFKFLPGNPADCTGTTTSFTTPDIAFGLAGTAQPQIATLIDNWTPSASEMATGTCQTNTDCAAATPVCANGTCIAPAPLELQAAARLDAGAFAGILSFLQGKEPPNVAAAMFFVNRAPDLTNDCVPPLAGGNVQSSLEAQILAAFNGTPSLQTYFVVLDDDAHDTASATGALTFFQKVQSDLPQAVQVLDATQTDSMAAAETAAANFSKLVTQLGTCLYDYALPAGTDPSTVSIAYTDPLSQSDTFIPSAAGCRAATQSTVDGWGIDTGRLRICGASCDNLRQTILNASGAALQSNMPVPDVPLMATVLCSGTAPVQGGSIGAADSGTSAREDATVGTGGSGPPPDFGDASSTVDGSVSLPDGGPAPIEAGVMSVMADGALP